MVKVDSRMEHGRLKLTSLLFFLLFLLVLMTRSVYGEEGFIWPASTTDCEINTLYYYLNFNNGGPHLSHFSNFNTIDIGANGGSNVEILAVADGVVTTVTYSTSSGFGNYIVIKHTDNTETWYCHLASMKVNSGDAVKQGQVIGIMGNTSAKYRVGVHLHFEWSGGNPWEKFYKDKYFSRMRINKEVYQANKKHSGVAACQNLVSYVDNYLTLKSGASYYTPSARINISSDIPEIFVDEKNGFSWEVLGIIKRQDVKWVSSNTSVLAVDNNGSIKGISEGTATVTAYAERNGKRICESSKTVKVKKRINLSNVTISLEKTSYEYTGSAKNPSVKASYQGVSLTKGNDYTVSYSGNVKVGIATVTITGKGNFTGSVKKNFTIEPVFKISPTSKTVDIRKTRNFTIKTTVKAGTAKTQITWKSSNKKVAQVSSKGVVLIKKKGTVTITATLKTESGTMSRSCSIVVSGSALNTQAATAKWKKACKAYQTFLSKNQSKFKPKVGDFSTKNKENYKKADLFLIVDLDKNGVPELVINHPKAYKQNYLYIFTYKNRKVTAVKNEKLEKAEINISNNAAGYYDVYICNKKHLHVDYKGGWFGLGSTDSAYFMKSGKLRPYLQGKTCKTKSNSGLKANTKQNRKKYLK